MSPLQFFLDYGFYIGAFSQSLIVAAWFKWVHGKGDEPDSSLNKKLKSLRKWNKW